VQLVIYARGNCGAGCQTCVAKALCWLAAALLVPLTVGEAAAVAGDAAALAVARRLTTLTVLLRGTTTHIDGTAARSHGVGDGGGGAGGMQRLQPRWRTRRHSCA
jgi:hypothetical protein